MIESAKNYEISSILKTDSNVRYEIPKYQRRYTWSQDDWEALFDDIWFNDRGHFLGSIICINTTKDSSAEQQCLDLVDGQQRLTTLSLLYAAIHTWLSERRSQLDDDGADDLRDVKRRLVLRRSNDERVSPSLHGNNLADYRAVLCECGVIEDVETPLYAGNRRIFKAYRYFCSRLNETSGDGEPKFRTPDIAPRTALFSALSRQVWPHRFCPVSFEGSAGCARHTQYEQRHFSS